MSSVNKMNIEDCDLMDNLVPLWEDKNLSEKERILTYVCVVLNERCQNLSNRINELEKLQKTSTNEQIKQTPRGLIGLNISGTQIGTFPREKISNSLDSSRKGNLNTPQSNTTPMNSDLNYIMSKSTNTSNPYLKEEIHHRKRHSKKSSKKNIHEIKKSIKDVKRTLDELKRSSRKN